MIKISFTRIPQVTCTWNRDGTVHVSNRNHAVLIAQVNIKLCKKSICHQTFLALELIKPWTWRELSRSIKTTDNAVSPGERSSGWRGKFHNLSASWKLWWPGLKTVNWGSRIILRDSVSRYPLPSCFRHTHKLEFVKTEGFEFYNMNTAILQEFNQWNFSRWTPESWEVKYYKCNFPGIWLK